MFAGGTNLRSGLDPAHPRVPDADVPAVRAAIMDCAPTLWPESPRGVSVRAGHTRPMWAPLGTKEMKQQGAHKESGAGRGGRGRRGQRKGGALLPTNDTKEMMQPCLIHLHMPSLCGCAHRSVEQLAKTNGSAGDHWISSTEPLRDQRDEETACRANLAGLRHLFGAAGVLHHDHAVNAQPKRWHSIRQGCVVSLGQLGCHRGWRWGESQARERRRRKRRRKRIGG